MKENEVWRIQQVNLSRLAKSWEKDHLDPHERFSMRSLFDAVAVEYILLLYGCVKIVCLNVITSGEPGSQGSPGLPLAGDVTPCVLVSASLKSNMAAPSSTAVS